MTIINKKQINLIAYILIGLAIILAGYLAIERINIEKEYDQVEIMVNLTELKALANANDMGLGELANQFLDSGVTGVLVKETSLGDLARTGQVQFFQGQEVQLSPFAKDLAKEIPDSNANIIITLHDKEIEARLVEHLENKLAGVKYFPSEVSALVIPVNIPNSDREKELLYEDLKSIGVGFDLDELTSLANLGITINPQVRDWPHPTKEALTYVAEETKSISNLGLVMFNDKQVPGYPAKMQILIDELQDKSGQVSAPVGMVEFFNQKGLAQFATLLNKKAVRVHSIALNDMVNYDPQSAIERYELAVSERNIRSLFVRFFDMDNPAKALDINLDYIQNLKGTLEKEGYQIGKAEHFKSPPYSRIIIGLIGLGVIAGGLLILTNKNWTLLAVILGLFGILAWGGILFISPIMARKLMSLASVIVFPTLAFLVVISERPRGLGESILALLKMSAISLVGAILMVGLLADKLFMLKLDQFVGVKAAHLIPLLIIPLLIFILNGRPIETIRKLLDQFITYRYVLLAGLALIALAIYVIRTGNEGTALVSGLEEKVRAGLKEILGVRPRTKEFFIGHPFTLFVLYFGLNRKNWFLILPAIIGQVSLVNTYAHIHTPLLISMIRSANGLWIGIIIGIVMIYGWKMVQIRK